MCICEFANVLKIRDPFNDKKNE